MFRSPSSTESVSKGGVELACLGYSSLPGCGAAHFSLKLIIIDLPFLSTASKS